MDSDSDSDSSRSRFDDSDEEEELYTAEAFFRDMQWVKNNDPSITELVGSGGYGFIQNITNERWEEIGRDISHNTYLKKLDLYDGALNDDKISFLFRGLARSTSIQKLDLEGNNLSAAVVRSMVPFLEHSNNLRDLHLDGNNLQSDGFNILCRALRDSPIEQLDCCLCGIESIEIDTDYFPRRLTHLNLASNKINADGCRGLAKLLQRGDSTIIWLNLNMSKIDDEGVAILVDALRSNTSLMDLFVEWNDDITLRGKVMLLKLVNDISSIKATLQSNHTLRRIDVNSEDIQIQQLIYKATVINKYCGNPEAAGREKMIQTQLHSVTRAALAELQGVSQSLYSEIDPLHLPEVLSLVGLKHGQGEMYVALKSSVAGVISTVNRRECIVQRLAYHKAKIAEHTAKSAELGTELVKFEAYTVDVESN